MKTNIDIQTTGQVCFRPCSNEGFATLGMSLLLLFLITLVTLTVSRTISIEQKVANNDARSKMAFEAAESGLSAALDFLSNSPPKTASGNIQLSSFYNTDIDQDGNNDIYAVTAGTGSVEVRYYAHDEDPATATPLMETNESLVKIVSRGFSDDRTATRTITQVGSKLDPLKFPPQNPLTARLYVNTTGTADVINPEGNTTIWSGDEVTLSGNTETQIADPYDPNYPECMTNSTITCGTITSSEGTKGVDIIDYDTNLENLTPRDQFKNFFGMYPEEYRQAMATIDVDAAVDDVGDAVDKAVNEVIWVEGDASFHSAVIGCAIDLNPGDSCPAGETGPSVLVVNGDATFSGSPFVYGFVFVLGSLDLGAGTTEINGALVSSEDVQQNGTFEITYNSNLLSQARNNGLFNPAAGSWRDF